MNKQENKAFNRLLLIFTLLITISAAVCESRKIILTKEEGYHASVGASWLCDISNSLNKKRRVNGDAKEVIEVEYQTSPLFGSLLYLVSDQKSCNQDAHRADHIRTRGNSEAYHRALREFHIKNGCSILSSGFMKARYANILFFLLSLIPIAAITDHISRDSWRIVIPSYSILTLVSESLYTASPVHLCSLMLFTEICLLYRSVIMKKHFAIAGAFTGLLYFAGGTAMIGISLIPTAALLLKRDFAKGYNGPSLKAKKNKILDLLIFATAFTFIIWLGHGFSYKLGTQMMNKIISTILDQPYYDNCYIAGKYFSCGAPQAKFLNSAFKILLLLLIVLMTRISLKRKSKRVKEKNGTNYNIIAIYIIGPLLSAIYIVIFYGYKPYYDSYILEKTLESFIFLLALALISFNISNLRITTVSLTIAIALAAPILIKLDCMTSQIFSRGEEERHIKSSIIEAKNIIKNRSLRNSENSINRGVEPKITLLCYDFCPMNEGNTKEGDESYDLLDLSKGLVDAQSLANPIILKRELEKNRIFISKSISKSSFECMNNFCFVRSFPS